MSARNNRGKWTSEEHQAFLRGIEMCGRDWEALASILPTRTALQIRTHAQKYFAKIDHGEPFPEQPYPSQYSAEAGQACVRAGAHEYDRKQQEQWILRQQGGHHPGFTIGTQHEPAAAAATGSPGFSADITDIGASSTVPPFITSSPSSAYVGIDQSGGSGGSSSSGGGGGDCGFSPPPLTRASGGDKDGRHAGMTAAAPASCASAWSFGDGEDPPNPPVPGPTMKTAASVAHSTSSTLGSGGSTPSSSYCLADSTDAGYAWGGAALAGRHDRGVRGTQRRTGGGDSLQRGGERPAVGASPPGVDDMHARMPSLEQPQWPQHQDQLHELRRLLLEDESPDEDNADQGHG